MTRHVLFGALLVLLLVPVPVTAQVSRYVRVVSAHGVPPLIGNWCVSGTAGARYHTYGVTATNPSAEVYVFDGAVFHSPIAGCALTLENPQHTGWIGDCGEPAVSNRIEWSDAEGNRWRIARFADGRWCKRPVWY